MAEPLGALLASLVANETYVLYTDTDAMFHEDITISDFLDENITALPTYFTLGAEINGTEVVRTDELEQALADMSEFLSEDKARLLGCAPTAGACAIRASRSSSSCRSTPFSLPACRPTRHRAPLPRTTS